jgi:hypothetical protein
MPIFHTYVSFIGKLSVYILFYVPPIKTVKAKDIREEHSYRSVETKL